MRKSGSIVAFMLLLMIHSSLILTMCKNHELEALLEFKQSFVENPRSLISSWVGDDCCHWLGVACDNVTGNVIKLNLRNQPAYDAYGYLSRYKSESSLVSSGVSSALLKLKFLHHLDLSWNNFTGSRIPEFIGSMMHLTYLNLSSAGFGGLIPPQLGNLTNLIHLDLNAHGDDVYVPYIQGHLEWAFGLSKLKSLDMSTVDMSQALDSVQVLIRLPSLLELSLSGCELDNTQISNVVVTNTSTLYSSTLQSLSLNGNKFNGAVPLWLRNMSRLEFLNLGDGEFSSMEGGIWGIMGNPCNFKHLDLSDNLIAQADVFEPFITSPKCAAYDLEYLDLQYNKISGSLPSNLGLLENLKYFDISRNRFQGQVPASLAKLSALKYLDLSNNMLSGLIPDVLGHLTEIEHLDISSNSMQGTVSGIGNLSKLSFLDTSFNNINLNFNSSVNRGHLFQLRVFNVQSCGINTVFPQWLRNQTQIQRLDLSYTGISGGLPEWLQNMSDIQSLQLAGNQLTGSLPRHMACDGCNLQVLDLHSNMLHGTIPNWLSHLENIVVLDLSENLLSGVIFEGENASSLLSGRIPLAVLDLSDNMLSGEIQMKSVYTYTSMLILSLRWNNFSGLISSQLCQFQYLKILELAHNRLTGHIPRCLGSMLFMNNVVTVNVDNSLVIQEIIKGVTEQFAGTLGPHTMIDLAYNHFVGTIPDGITSMSEVMQLNLSNNHLTGVIPGEIGNLQMLESLDLSNNNLSGTIPQSLSEIPWLSVLNLSYNNLHGPIPTGNQLQTLDNPSIYAGNSGLCGFPLPDKCFNPKPPPSPTGHDDEHGAEKDNEGKNKLDKLWLYLAVMSGVATGFWGVIGTLVFKKSWRHAYFRFVEETADKIYVPVKIRVNKFKNRKRNVIEI